MSPALVRAIICGACLSAFRLQQAKFYPREDDDVIDTVSHYRTPCMCDFEAAPIPSDCPQMPAAFQTSQAQLLNFVGLIVVMIFLWAVAGVILFGDQSQYFLKLVRGFSPHSCSLSTSQSICIPKPASARA